ncbi:MAG: methyltransferase domain-containing protein [Pseudomonadota bacterium]
MSAGVPEKDPDPVPADDTSANRRADPRRLHPVETIQDRLQAITEAARIDLAYLHDDRSRAHVADACRDLPRVLDVGGGMRGHLDGHPGVETLDLNDLDDGDKLYRPDLLGDICSPLPPRLHGRYDAAVALAILEHVYDPPAAVANLRVALRPGGRLFVYVPWMWRYHAPQSLIFQDYQRFSRDGLAYLLRDFEDVTLYPLRGKYSAIANMLRWWKPAVERRVGGRLNRWLDARTSTRRNTIQASGYFAEARRP